jgi:SAM-dependent methyltransferase
MAEEPTDWKAIWKESGIPVGAAETERRTPRWKAQEELVHRLLGSFDGLEVIEIGAGRGINALIYGKLGAKVTLLDVEQIALDQAAVVFEAEGVPFTPVLGDAFALAPELRGAFDVSMSFGLCEHFLGERRRAIVGAHLELLRPGGLAMIGVPNRHAPIYRLWKATLTRRGGWPIGTEEPFTAGELAALVRASGGEPLPARYGSFVGSVVNHGVNQALHKLGRRPLREPQIQLPLLDRLAYELLLPARKPGRSDGGDG